MGQLVKICGINSRAAADAVMAAHADFAGLVFHPKSPRKVTPDQAKALAEIMRGRVKLVVLVADADDAAIAAAVAAVHPDFLQLHGNESPERVTDIRAKFSTPVIKAIAVSAAGDIDSHAGLIDTADMVLFDAKPPKSADRPGGWGAPFDWAILRGAVVAKPWLLAGGLTPQNVASAIALSGTPGVDVSSGVESAPGVKDTGLISAFVCAARSVNS